MFFETDFTFANYADDNTIYASAANKAQLIKKLSDATCIAIRWFIFNNMQANANKFQFIIFGKKQGTEPLKLDVHDSLIVESDHVKLLGITLDKKLDYKVHVKSLCRKTAWQIAALGRISKFLSVEAKLTIFRTFIVSNLEYCKVVWNFCSKTDANKLEKLQERALRIVLSDYSSSYNTLLEKSKTKTLLEGRLQATVTEIFKSQRGLTPTYISQMFNKTDTGYLSHRKYQLSLFRRRTTAYGLKSFSHYGATLWNHLPNNIKELESVDQFKKGIKAINLTGLKPLYAF